METIKSIEERAKEAYPAHEYSVLERVMKRGAYIRGAKEQKAIDDAKWLKIKSSWEKEAQINHDDVANRKQGYHDAIEEAYKWIKANTEGGVHPQNAYGFADRFLKEMEK